MMVSFAQYELELRKVISARTLTSRMCQILLTDIYGIRDSMLDNNCSKRDQNIARWTSACLLDVVTVVQRVSEPFRIHPEKIEMIQECSDILSSLRNTKPPNVQLFSEANNIRQRIEELIQIKEMQQQDME